MLNFAPTEEQEEIRNLARSMAVEQLRPQGRSAEGRGDISPELMQTLERTGLTMPFPEKYGGSGAIEAMTYTLIAEELGFGDGGLAMNIIGSLMGPVSVMLMGDESQQEHYISPFCEESSAHLQRGSLAFAERSGGYVVADISMTARKEGEHYIVNGTKRDVIHGEKSMPRVVLLRMEGTSGVDGLCALMVPAQVEGLRFTHDVRKLGLIAAPSAAFVFEDVAVSQSCMLGQPGHRGVVRAAALFSILRAGVACGMARAALEYARDYAKERIAFGRPIASYQGIAFIVAEMAMHLDAARLLVWRAAATWDQDTGNVGATLAGRGLGDGVTRLTQDAEAVQRQAIAIAKSATIDAIQVLGGAGFMRDHPAEMWMRNAAAME